MANSNAETSITINEGIRGSPSAAQSLGISLTLFHPEGGPTSLQAEYFSIMPLRSLKKPSRESPRREAMTNELHQQCRHRRVCREYIAQPPQFAQPVDYGIEGSNLFTLGVPTISRKAHNSCSCATVTRSRHRGTVWGNAFGVNAERSLPPAPAVHPIRTACKHSRPPPFQMRAACPPMSCVRT